MSIERRKVYVEFISDDTCIITTLFKQKTIQLKDNDIIDLITLEKIKGNFDIYEDSSCSLYGIANQCSKKTLGIGYVELEIIAQIQPSVFSTWDYVNIFENKKCIEGNIYIND